MLGDVSRGGAGFLLRIAAAQRHRYPRRIKQEDAVARETEAAILLVGQRQFRCDAGDAIIVGGLPLHRQPAGTVAAGRFGKGCSGRRVGNERNLPGGDIRGAIPDPDRRGPGKFGFGLEQAVLEFGGGCQPAGFGAGRARAGRLVKGDRGLRGVGNAQGKHRILGDNDLRLGLQPLHHGRTGEQHRRPRGIGRRFQPGIHHQLHRRGRRCDRDHVGNVAARIAGAQQQTGRQRQPDRHPERPAINVAPGGPGRTHRHGPGCAQLAQPVFLPDRLLQPVAGIPGEPVVQPRYGPVTQSGMFLDPPHGLEARRPAQPEQRPERDQKTEARGAENGQAGGIGKAWQQSGKHQGGERAGDQQGPQQGSPGALETDDATRQRNSEIKMLASPVIVLAMMLAQKGQIVPAPASSQLRQLQPRRLSCQEARQ